MLGAIRDGFVVTRDGVLTEANDELLRMTGFSREELIGTARALPVLAPRGRTRRRSRSATAS